MPPAMEIAPRVALDISPPRTATASPASGSSSVVVVSAARAGPSGASACVRRASAARPAGWRCKFAAAVASDEEMEARISQHQAERDDEWTTIEEPVELDRVLVEIDNEDTVIIDCLALWVTNQLDDTDDEVLWRADDIIRLLRWRQGDSLVVTNEVGSGIVPVNATARRFRDLLGTVNQRFARGADRTLLCVTGGVVPVVGLEDL